MSSLYKCHLSHNKLAFAFIPKPADLLNKRQCDNASLESHQFWNRTNQQPIIHYDNNNNSNNNKYRSTLHLTFTLELPFVHILAQSPMIIDEDSLILQFPLKCESLIIQREC
jgi:hypothetical protein